MRLTGHVRLLLSFLLLLAGLSGYAKDGVIEPTNPPRLVNDFAHVLKPGQADQLEEKLREFDRKTTNQITIVTLQSLNGREVQEYSVDIFRSWGLGQKGRNNGVLMLVAIEDRKAWITTGQGLQGVLTDAKAGLIFRNELRPAFQQKNYYKGLSDAADAIIAVTKDEYKADGKHKDGRPMPLFAIIIIVIVVAFIIKMFGGGNNNRGGGYVSNRGWGDIATGMLIGELLSGGRRGGGGWGGGGSGGGGWGGFGGGSTDGGGAGGSW